MDFFYPLPNQGTMANGYGVYQQFVLTRDRQRGDIRVDYEPSTNDSVFARGSFQHRNPNNIIFEAGNAFTNLPVLNTTLNTAAVIGGWTEIIARRSSTSSAPAATTTTRAGKHVPGVGRHRPARHRERAEPRRRPAASPVRSGGNGRPTTSPMPDATSTEPFDRTPFR